KEYKEQNPANIYAAELMGKLHDRLKEIGYTGHPLEVYLVRILFLLFAEDTTIFEKQLFQDFIERRTNEDGSDLAAKLQELFQVLNTPIENRFNNLDEDLNAFPYINGKLFEETLHIASFDSKMRQALLNCTYLDWSEISPAIFGSMFQSVMNPIERRNLGAHYTSETNILKLIKPLFLDELWYEFEKIKDASTDSTQTRKLIDFHKKLKNLKFLDPACGCGNFLVITYRELRLLELDILRALYKTSGVQVIDVSSIIWLDVDQFYGIEYEEFPARIAEVAMWLIDHQMNMKVSSEFGQYFVRIPLEKSATIIHGDALEINWQTLLNPVNVHYIQAEHTDIFVVGEKEIPYGKVNVETKSYSIHSGLPEMLNENKFDYIFGNPPFIGSKIMKQKQRDQIVKLFDNFSGSGVLDYVTGWYIKAAKYIMGTKTKVAFVSTNSIVQGEQTSILWKQMLVKYNIKIHFAHRTFKWSNEAKGNAAVYCVIIGFANFDTQDKSIFEYENIKGGAQEVKAKNINPYLVDARDVFILSRSRPICNVSIMKFGNQPIDGGFLLLKEEEKEFAIKTEPFIEKYIRQYVGSREFINDEKRYCLWLKNALPEEMHKSKFILRRLQQVKDYRKNTSLKGKNILPSQFALESHQESEYIIVPSVSSERREYIPMGFMPANVIASNLCLIIPNATLYEFGILASKIHMVWVKNICGRLKSDYRYSATIVYNNYPFPENSTEKQVKAIETAVQKVLDVRAQFPNSSLADLYDPLTMPLVLIKAHNELDKAVDLSYRPQPFISEANRMEFLFGLYEKYTADLFTKVKPKKKKIKV
ncbi:MAG: methylase, partial [Bacteroidales bacterium]|nr:methylase [Bacteroidales bacterium]